MDRYARGEDAAFGDVYDAVEPRVRAFALRGTRDRAAAEDLTQHTFLRMHAARASYVEGSDVLAWAFAIARSLMIDRNRRLWREVVLEQPEQGASRDPAPDEVVQATQAKARLQKALAGMPEKQRVAFELLKFDGLSIAHAAEVLGVTSTAVKLRAHRAYEALRESLGDDELDDNDRKDVA